MGAYFTRAWTARHSLSGSRRFIASRRRILPSWTCLQVFVEQAFEGVIMNRRFTLGRTVMEWNGICTFILIQYEILPSVMGLGISTTKPTLAALLRYYWV